MIDPQSLGQIVPFLEPDTPEQPVPQVGAQEMLNAMVAPLRAERAQLSQQYRQMSQDLLAIAMKKAMARKPVMAAPMVNPREAGIAGGVAALASLLGARNAPQALSGFLGGRQNVLNQGAQNQFAQDVNQFQQQQAMLDAQAGGIDADLRQIAAEIGGVDEQIQGAFGLAREDLRQQGMTSRTAQTNQTRLTVAEMNNKTEEFKATLNAEVRRELGDKVGMIYRALIRAGATEEQAREAVMAEYNESIARTQLTRERTATEKQLRPIKVEQGQANIRRTMAQTSYTQALERFLPQRIDNERARIEQGWITAARRGQEFSQDDIRQQERFIRDDITAANKQLADLRKERREAVTQQAQINSLYPEGSAERKAAMDAIAAIDAEIKGLQQVVTQANARLNELRTARPAVPVNPNAPMAPTNIVPSLSGPIGGTRGR